MILLRSATFKQRGSRAVIKPKVTGRTRYAASTACSAPPHGMTNSFRVERGVFLKPPTILTVRVARPRQKEV
jgi:hypothetical protein